MLFIEINTCIFFSSTRRHTSLQGDWSSDVCSSDLAQIEQRDFRHAAPAEALRKQVVGIAPGFGVDARLDARRRRHQHDRSEERRVGKGSGYGWWTARDYKEEGR